jgi:CMP-N,N'-diacetyllegionaminic acid synthase
MTRITAIIPARSGSKGVPDKNIKKLAGYPLIAWSIAACLKSRLVERVVVSTDSVDYANIAKSFGADIPFIRPKDLAGDNSTDLDFIIHALDCFKNTNQEPEYLVHIRPTTPLRNPLIIDEAINLLIKHDKATALRSVHEMAESAYKTFEISLDGRLKKIASDDFELDSSNNARQKFPPTYQANGYVDVLKTEFIRKYNLIHGGKVIPFLTDAVTEIDSMENFDFLEFQVQNNPNLSNLIFG